jgi:hypothetical protein
MRRNTAPRITSHRILTPRNARNLMNTLEIAIVTSAIRARVNELTASGDTDEAALLAAIEQDVPDAHRIVTLLVRAVGEAEAEADAITERIAGLAARKDRAKRRAATMRGLLFAAMEAAGVAKWTHPEFTVSVSQGRPGVIITDEAALPDECFRTVREIDKTKTKQLLSEGIPIAGAELANGMPTLTIRSK